jgi:hypothetical protein
MVPPSSARAAVFIWSTNRKKRQYQNRLTHVSIGLFLSRNGVNYVGAHFTTERSQGEDGQDYLTAIPFSREKYG